MVYEPPTAPLRSASAEQDKNAFAAPLLALKDEAQLRLVLLADDPRASEQHPSYQVWRSDVTQSLLLLRLTEDLIDGVDRGETFRSGEFENLSSLRVALAEENNALLGTRGRSPRIERAVLDSHAIPQEWNGWADRVPAPRASLADAADSTQALSQVFLILSSSTPDTRPARYWVARAAVAQSMAVMLGFQAEHVERPLQGERPVPAARVNLGRRYGNVARVLVTYHLEDVSHDLAARMATELSPDNIETIRGTSVTDVNAPSYFLGWWFYGTGATKPLTPENFNGALASWQIVREVVPNLASNGMGADLGALRADLKEGVKGMQKPQAGG